MEWESERLTHVVDVNPDAEAGVLESVSDVDCSRLARQMITDEHVIIAQLCMSHHNNISIIHTTINKLICQHASSLTLEVAANGFLRARCTAPTADECKHSATSILHRSAAYSRDWQTHFPKLSPTVSPTGRGSWPKPTQWFTALTNSPDGTSVGSAVFAHLPVWPTQQTVSHAVSVAARRSQLLLRCALIILVDSIRSCTNVSWWLDWVSVVKAAFHDPRWHHREDRREDVGVSGESVSWNAGLTTQQLGLG